MKTKKFSRALMACVLSALMLFATCATSFAAITDWTAEDVIDVAVDGALIAKSYIEAGYDAIQAVKDEFSIVITGEDDVYAMIYGVNARFEELIAAAQSVTNEDVNVAIAENLAYLQAILGITEADKADVEAVVNAAYPKLLAVVDAFKNGSDEAKIEAISDFYDFIKVEFAITAEQEACVLGLAEKVKAEVIAFKNASDEEKTAKIDAYIEYLKDALDITAEDEALIMAYVEDIKAIIESIDEEDFAFIGEGVDAAKAKADAIKAEVEAYIADIKAGINKGVAKIGHEHYEATEGSYYVAIGGSTVAGEGISRDDSAYHDLIADELGIEKFAAGVENAPVDFADVADLIVANAASIAAADLITYQADASSFVYALLADTCDWDKYVDADTQAIIAEVFAQAQAVVAEDWAAAGEAGIDAIVSEICTRVAAAIEGKVSFDEAKVDAIMAQYINYVKAALVDVEAAKDGAVEKAAAVPAEAIVYAEKLAYAVVAYAAESVKAVNTIQAINPDATLVVVGMYNPFNGLEVVVGGNAIDAGEYFEYAIDATNLYYAAISAVNGNIAFVDVADAETNGFEAPEALSIEQIGAMLISAVDSMHANAAGHEYIKDQILAALVCDYSVYEAKDAEYHYVKCAICDYVKGVEEHDGDVCSKCGYEKVVVTPEPTPAPTPAPTRRPSSGGGVVSNKFTVTFDSNGGSKVASASVKKGEVVAEPVAPTKAGFVFDGWYTDKALTAKYDFATPVTKSFTLYAKWADAFGFFKDLDANAWYYDYVKSAVQMGLMNGVSKTEFAPNAALTRGMFVTILYRLEGTPEIKAENKFTDVAAGSYYADAVAWANANGIVKGISDTEYAPNAEITREQMAAVAARYLAFKKVEAEALAELDYKDAAEIAEYAVEAIKTAETLEILVGHTDGTFGPKENATRAQAAALFVRLAEVLAK